jgi:omega-6 fatty acid desaturase (delta-12 desaturase)
MDKAMLGFTRRESYPLSDSQVRIMSHAKAFDPLPKIIRKIPKHCLRSEPLKAWFFIGRDILVISVLVTAIHSFSGYFLPAVFSVLLGIAMTGIFVIAHDAGHRSFSTKLWVNNLVGEIFSAILLWPFHVWRLSHDTHHKFTHHISKEIAWRPFSREKVERLPPPARFIYLQTRSWFYWVGSIFFLHYFVKDGLRGLRSRHFRPDEIAMIYRSVVITILVAGLMTWAAWTADGVRGLLLYVALPQLTFQFWMSTFTFFHHTSPDSPFMNEEIWDPGRAQLGSTIHMRYPAWVDWLTHDISWHVPHHVCVGIPHYHLREAHEALKSAYPEIVREEGFTFAYVRKVLSSCHLAGAHHAGFVAWEAYRDKTAAPAAAIFQDA